MGPGKFDIFLKFTKNLEFYRNDIFWLYNIYKKYSSINILAI